MKVYQANNESVNGSIQIRNSELLYAKAQNGLLELSVSLGLEVMRMMLEENVAQFAGPKGKHKTKGRTGYRHGSIEDLMVQGQGFMFSTEARPSIRAYVTPSGRML